MLDGLEALIALERHGTVSEAAHALRLTQSAITKRLQSLENELGYKILEKEGRSLRLTQAGLVLLAKAKPLLFEIEGLRYLKTEAPQVLSIGIADSIASSWGPAVIRKSLGAVSRLELELHVHRSTLIVENIKLGRYHLGLVSGSGLAEGLVSSQIATEEMVFIQGRNSQASDAVFSMEPVSATWKEVGARLLEHRQLHNKKFQFVESFVAAAQMARQGFGSAIVPQGVAMALQIPKAEWSSLSPKIKRSIFLVARKSIFDFEKVQQLEKHLKVHADNEI